MGKLVAHANVKKKANTNYSEEELPILVHAILVVIACFTFPIISSKAIIPYLSGVFNTEVTSVIGNENVTLMLIMLAALLILPISFIPFMKNDKRRLAPIYMAGENTGDNETFYGAMKIPRKVEIRNWYMESYFGSKKLTAVSNIIAIGILVTGIILIIMEVAK